MDDLYSIGETAKLNDISIKSLRHYDEIGLLRPMFIDPDTGYRYYAYSQFSFIDKIKRFKNVGISLKDLKEVFQTKDLGRLEDFLRDQKRNLETEARRLEDQRQDIEWLVDFLEYSKSCDVDNTLSIRERPAMHVIRVPCDGDDSMYAMDMELRRIAMSPELRGCQILNPYGYLLDFDRLMAGSMYPVASTVCIRELPAAPCRYVDTIPGGLYLCCKARILSDTWDISPMVAYCRDHRLRPTVAVALEYLTSLYDPRNSPYELALLLPPGETGDRIPSSVPKKEAL